MNQRKPFEPLKGKLLCEFCGEDSWVEEEKANAAIAQDKAEHERFCEQYRTLVRDKRTNDDALAYTIQERDQLRAENEKLRAEVGRLQSCDDHRRDNNRILVAEGKRLMEEGAALKAQLAEAEAKLGEALGVIEECAERLSADSQSLFENDMKYSAEAAESSAEKARQFLASLKEEK